MLYFYLFNKDPRGKLQKSADELQEISFLFLFYFCFL